MTNSYFIFFFSRFHWNIFCSARIVSNVVKDPTINDTCSWSHGWYSTITTVNNSTTVSKIRRINCPGCLDWVAKRETLCTICFKETKCSDNWCKILNYQWHMWLKWGLTFNSHTSHQINYSHKEQKNQLSQTSRLSCKKENNSCAQSALRMKRNQTLRHRKSWKWRDGSNSDITFNTTPTFITQ